MVPNPSLSVDVVVVGGGLAGLTASILLAQRGRSVCLVERSAQLGGRAVTQRNNGYSLNLGPHALFLGGDAERILRTLDLMPQGGPALTQGFAGLGEQLHRLPAGAGSLLTTGLLSAKGKAGALLFLSRLMTIEPLKLQGKTVGDWLQTEHPEVRQFAEMLVRLSSYAAAPDRQDAVAALKQLRRAMRSGALYPDDGWQSMVDSMKMTAVAAGVQFKTGSVTHVLHDARVHGVQLANGETLAAGAVILTPPPAVTAGLLNGAAQATIQGWSERLVPVKAACLDIALRRLPRPKATLVLGCDRPWYLAVHSATARLAPSGGAVIHAAWYLNPDRPDASKQLGDELEAVLDQVQPGWRDELVSRRFMPSLTVTNALDTSAGRPEPDAAQVEGLYLAGDWVAAESMLADASMGSAERAVQLALASPSKAIHPPSLSLS